MYGKFAIFWLITWNLDVPTLMLEEMVDKAADNEADKMVEEVAEIER